MNPDQESFSIVIPPPNVTGVLHVGHALNNTMQDVLIRYKRMSGFNTLWVPGTDHAAVATQAKVEKLLVKEGVKNPREDLGREELLNRIRKYAEESKSTIIKQVKKIRTAIKIRDNTRIFLSSFFMFRFPILISIFKIFICITPPLYIYRRIAQ